jgi:hypothetical protein
MAAKSSQPMPFKRTQRGEYIMLKALRRRDGWLLVAAALLGLIAGCSDGNAKYKPTANEARTSLETALTAWRDGKPYGPIETTPPVHIVNSQWQAGQQIESFQIGDEEDPGDGTKQFVVKLTMKGKSSIEQDARFIVHGRDPVYVFGEEDYKRMANMDNNPVIPKPKANTQRSGNRR